MGESPSPKLFTHCQQHITHPLVILKPFDVWQIKFDKLPTVVLHLCNIFHSSHPYLGTHVKSTLYLIQYNGIGNTHKSSVCSIVYTVEKGREQSKKFTYSCFAIRRVTCKNVTSRKGFEWGSGLGSGLGYCSAHAHFNALWLKTMMSKFGNSFWAPGIPGLTSDSPTEN